MIAVKKIKVLLFFQVPSFWASWETLFYALKCDERFDVEIVLLDEGDGDTTQMKGAESFLQREKINYTLYDYDEVLSERPDYVFFQTPYDYGHRKIDSWSIRFKLNGIKVVYIPYGIEISDTVESRFKHFSLPVIRNAFRIYTMSDEMKAQYDKYCVNGQCVRGLGHPRFEGLAKHYELGADLRQRIGKRKIVLWKVHFPKIFIENGVKKTATPDIDEYLKFAEWISGEEQLFFIFMPHPKFTDITADAMTQRKAVSLLNKLEMISNVYVDRDEDYRTSLTNADAIIVDRSAIMIEAATLGVPVLYMHNAVYDEPMTEPCRQIIEEYMIQGTEASDMVCFCDTVKKDISLDKLEQSTKKLFPISNISECIIEDLWHSRNQNVFAVKLPRGSKVIIWGAGKWGKECIKAYENRKANVELLGLIDSNISEPNHHLNDIPVYSKRVLNDVEYDYVVIATDKYYREIYLELRENIGIADDKIINYDQFICLCELNDGVAGE